VATSTLRFAIIVALVIGGAVLIAQFPDTSTSAIGTGTPPATTTPSPSGGGNNNGNGGNGQESPSPPVQGVRLAVYNGTYETGLAADVTDKLERRFGYKINHETSILDAESKPYEQTTLYFVTGADKPAAEALADGFFKKLDVKMTKLPADSQVPPGVQVAVYLGTDYAALR
jgi:LytR cell envelope-related transcriptional attenuator